MPTIQGTYEAEGPNVSGAAQKALTGDVPAMNTMSSTGPGGNQQSVAIDVRRRLRVSTEAARAGVAISVGSADQVLAKATRWVYIGTTGNLVVRLADDTADVTLSNVPVGLYQLAVAIVRKTGTTAAGVLLF